MKPVITPSEMKAIDASAPEPVEELIERAAWAVARTAIAMLDGAPYGKRVAVLAGSGNNGADGRAAVRHLQRRGAVCTVFDIGHPVDRPVPGATFDLIIDACYGTGLKRPFDPEALPVDPGATPVLAVDIPSGVDGNTGAILGRALCANVTVTFAAMKPGLLFEPGRGHAGRIEVADIGLDCSRAALALVETGDVASMWPRRAVDAHKWVSAVMVIGGGPGMTGAPALAAEAALRAGAGYVSLAVPGADRAVDPEGHGGEADYTPVEVVRTATGQAWARPALEAQRRFAAAVIGPGLAPVDRSHIELATYLDGSTTPTVFDAGAIDAMAALARSRPRGVADTALAAPHGQVRHVITPHDGEFARLADQLGVDRDLDRLSVTRLVASAIGAVVLRKGPTTVVAHPGGQALISTAGDQRLATAGSGDVLAGVVAAGLAGGLDPFWAAGLAAELHGLAGCRGYRVGMTAGDLPSQVAATLSELAGPG